MTKQIFFRIMLITFVFAGFLCSTASAQQWSAEQQEVWKAVESWWAMEAKNDVEGLKAIYHKDYAGWFWGDHFPANLAEAKRWVNHQIPKGKIAYTFTRPLTIMILGDVAVLHYFYSKRHTVKDKEVITRGRWTDVWKKEDGKWLLVADSGGILSSN